jgi:crotonobetainyl-CoA:carnitine CoA-transferase CaiB-like acyl-CoA transferase
MMGDHMGGLTYDPPLDKGGYGRHLSPDRRPYQTSDGYICAMVYNDKQWKSFLKHVGREELFDDPRFATFPQRIQHIDTVNAELSRIFKTRTTAEWAKLLDDADVPSTPMHTLESMMQDPHMLATDFFQQVEHPTEGAIRSMKVSATWSKTPVNPTRLASHLGEQNAEVLAEVGYTAEQIEKMHKDGVLRQAAIPDTSEL